MHKTMSYLLNYDCNFKMNDILEDMKLFLTEHNMIEWNSKLIQNTAINGHGQVCKAVNGMTPNYIQELFEVKEIPYNLKDPTRTIMLKSNSTTYVLKSLQHEGNKIWNRLIVDLKTSESLAILR